MTIEKLENDKKELETILQVLISQFANNYKEFDLSLTIKINDVSSVLHNSESWKDVHVDADLYYKPEAKENIDKKFNVDVLKEKLNKIFVDIDKIKKFHGIQ